MNRKAIAAAAIALICLTNHAAVAQPATNAQDARFSYAAALRRAFLYNGFSYDVVAFDWPSGEAKEGKFPQLMIFGYLSKSIIFRHVTDGKVLENAKRAGFSMVVFFDRGNEGLFYYDISSAALPRCDVKGRLCL